MLIENVKEFTLPSSEVEKIVLKHLVDLALIPEGAKVDTIMPDYDMLVLWTYDSTVWTESGLLEYEPK